MITGNSCVLSSGVLSVPSSVLSSALSSVPSCVLSSGVQSGLSVKVGKKVVDIFSTEEEVF